jgi:hypothetical protein
MGMIVSNAFMKRSFGKKLIENYLRHKDLTHVIDTSGLNFPGYGTPTTILFARNQAPLPEKPIRAVRGIVGIMNSDEDLINSPVWQEIVGHVEDRDYSGTRISVSDAARQVFNRHPWATGGGGAAELKESLDEYAEVTLKDLPADYGVQVVTGEDDVFVRPSSAFARNGVTDVSEFGFGDSLKDWSAVAGLVSLNPSAAAQLQLWPYRTGLSRRIYFGQSQVERGYDWWDFGIAITHRMGGYSIAFGEIATHNHFVLDRGQKVFNQTAPVIKLPAGATEDRYLELLGLLNSSTGCFWLKQVAHDKGGGGVGGGLATEPWEHFKCFTSSVVSRFPVPSEKSLELAKLIQSEADARSSILPEKLCAGGVPTCEALDATGGKAAAHLARMIALQEELDWLCYRLYGIIDEDLTASLGDVPPLELGQRTFEIRMAREGKETSWFERHHSRPITEFPSWWPEAYTQVCVRRLEVMQQNRDIALIEQPEYKRRWNLPTWEEMQQTALKNWLLDRMEANSVWSEHELVSCGRLRDALARDADWTSVAAIYNGGPVENLDDVVTRLAVSESVPFLPLLRYTETGQRKRAEWEQVWELQRQEDAGESVETPVPPKYRSNDFQKSDYWRLRGGLDVPKERFILYPGLERDGDQTPVLGWAGWNHLEQAQALGSYYQRMRTEEGWEPERLKPILAGLLDLGPWVLQWHNSLDPETGVRLGEYFVHFAESQCQELGFSPEDVRAWRRAIVANSGRRGRSSNRSGARRSQ